MISPPSKEQFNSRPEDSWPLFTLEFFWHGTLTELRVSDFSPETHRFLQLSAVAVSINPLNFFPPSNNKIYLSINKLPYFDI